jgi:protein TonB
MMALSPNFAREPREYLPAAFVALALHAGAVAALASVRPADRPVRRADSGFELVVLAGSPEPVVARVSQPRPEPEPEPEVAPPPVEPVPVETPNPPVNPPVVKKTAAVRPPVPVPMPPDAPGTETDATAVTDDAAQDPATLYTPPDGKAAYLHNPLPRYPRDARRRRIEGTVVLDVTVDAAGRPARVEVQSSSGFPMLDRAALEAVGGWRFEPARRRGVAIAGDVRVPVVFRLENS